MYLLSIKLPISEPVTLIPINTIIPRYCPKKMSTGLYRLSPKKRVSIKRSSMLVEANAMTLVKIISIGYGKFNKQKMLLKMANIGTFQYINSTTQDIVLVKTQSL